ncbi:MAG: KH domain-containing protein [Polyangiales bacterium]
MVIGPGGKTIKGIVDQTGVAIDIADDGTVSIASADGAAVQRAIDIIEGSRAEAEIGATYKGTVKRLTDYGAFIEIFPGTEGLLHVRAGSTTSGSRTSPTSSRRARRSRSRSSRSRRARARCGSLAARSCRSPRARRASAPRSVWSAPTPRSPSLGRPRRERGDRPRPPRPASLNPLPRRRLRAASPPLWRIVSRLFVQ